LLIEAERAKSSTLQNTIVMKRRSEP
jgi:hypothetical protein